MSGPAEANCSGNTQRPSSVRPASGSMLFAVLQPDPTDRLKPLMRTNLKTQLAAAIAVMLTCLAVLPAVMSSVARGAPEPPVPQLATLPQAVRVRRTGRHSAVRSIRSIRLRRLWQLCALLTWEVKRKPNLPRRVPLSTAAARGPPR